MIPTINKEFLYQKTINEQLWNIFRVYDNDNITIMFMGQLDSDEEVVVFGNTEEELYQNIENMEFVDETIVQDIPEEEIVEDEEESESGEEESGEIEEIEEESK